MAAARGPIDAQEAAYIELLILDADPDNKKLGMQKLCAHYRAGRRLRNPTRITTFLVGLLHDESAKVRRWALNSLALAGGKAQVPAILEAVQRDRLDPDILGAGIAALSALLDPEETRGELKKADLPLEGAILLAAAQQTEGFNTELKATRVDIDAADPPELRLATLLVGLSKAPDHLFGLHLPYGKVIGELNLHPDPIVAQYSVWATWENPRLGLRHLGLPLKDAETQPPNVRKYVYRLVVADDATARKHLDLLEMASGDPSVEAREGLASGMRDVFFDSIERLVLDWFVDEESDPVRQRLLEHMSVNAAKYGGYRVPVLKSYEAAKPDGLVRARLEAAARGTPLFSDMRRIALEPESSDLFGERRWSSPSRPTVTAPPAIRQITTQDGSASAEWINAEDLKARAQAARVLIVTALPKEAAAIKAVVDGRWKLADTDDPNLYELGIFATASEPQRDAVLASSGLGNLSACTLAANALRSFPNIEYILMVGIAGGCPNPSKPDDHVRLGDIVVSGDGGIVKYDYVKASKKKTEIRAHPQKPCAKMLGVVKDIAAEEMMGEHPWEATADKASQHLLEGFARPAEGLDVLHDGVVIVPHPSDPKRRVGSPRLHLGVIGAADALQKNAATRNMLRDKYQVRAIEMEASGIQHAAWVQGKGVLVIRGVCDYCDEHKCDTWQDYAALIAAAFARTVVVSMPHAWLK